MLTVDKIENKYLVTFYNINRLNVVNSKEIESNLMSLIMNEGVELTLNFSGINFIDSAGFDVLSNIQKESETKSVKLKLINLSEDLKELIKLVELDHVFQLN